MARNALQALSFGRHSHSALERSVEKAMITNKCADCGRIFVEEADLPPEEAGRCPICHSVSWGEVLSDENGTSKDEEGRFRPRKVTIPGCSGDFRPDPGAVKLYMTVGTVADR